MITLRRYIYLLLTLVSAFAAVAKTSEPNTTEVTAAEAFADMPLNVLDLLDRSTRLDMLEYARIDSVYDAYNRLEGKSHIDRLTPTWLKATLTDVSTLEIKILPSKKYGAVIMTLYTVGSEMQAADTGIEFFTPGMKPIPLKDCMPRPDVTDFFDLPKGSATSKQEIRDMIPFPVYEATSSPDSADLTLRLNLGNDIDRDNLNILRLFLRPDITYRWDGKKYKLIKN